MKPFVLLATRAEDVAADDEYAAFLRFGGLSESELVRIRLEQPDAPPAASLDLDAFSGVILGGSPFTTSVPAGTKSAEQVRVEADVFALLDRVVVEDRPFLGACYGVGTLGVHQGGVVDGTFGEAIGAVAIELTGEGAVDPLTSALPGSFEAFVGHKEAVTTLPDHAVLLASSASCPVQAFRVGRHVYATQFHPELDVPGLQTRIEVYRDYGYFEPHEAEWLKANAARAAVSEPPRLLQRFVELYAR
ncbi:glutamine amidotransferase [Nocardioides marmoribigeumensis]|uniref:GMP synthase (Glutamine-hydrolyzing) n=1 Tax=Nocardioides marmoribigeumensis TaxID=433649 RepID=A0ABU2BYQ3_9ACTN|nr:glutamine amidotransferase [Nocardioides marmoribigeumensis]MDR7363529.1 GMP synthase (glutamine-hydrolyzing) [Nocardioides marmoribigeumensis]